MKQVNCAGSLNRAIGCPMNTVFLFGLSLLGVSRDHIFCPTLEIENLMLAFEIKLSKNSKYTIHLRNYIHIILSFSHP